MMVILIIWQIIGGIQSTISFLKKQLSIMAMSQFNMNFWSAFTRILSTDMTTVFIKVSNDGTACQVFAVVHLT